MDQIRISMVFRIPIDCFKGNGTSSPYRAAKSDLERHRLQGHVPYDPRCTICARGKSTFSSPDDGKKARWKLRYRQILHS